MTVISILVRLFNSVLNVCSLTNHLHYNALANLALTTLTICSFCNLSHYSTTFSELSEFSLISTPHPVVGRGTDFVINNSSIIVSTSEIFKSFELSITITLLKSKLAVFNIYRNHSQTVSHMIMFLFLCLNQNSLSSISIATTIKQFHTWSCSFFWLSHRFSNFISTAATTPHEFLITDDFNLHTDNHSDLLSQQLPSLLNNANLIQHVNFFTHQAGHTLDLVITANDSTLLPTITRWLIVPSDRFPIFISLVKSPLYPLPSTEYFFCSIKSINLNFICDICTSRLVTRSPTWFHWLLQSQCQIFSISKHRLNQNFFDLNLQMLGSLLLFKKLNLLDVTLGKCGLVSTLLSTWNF